MTEENSGKAAAAALAESAARALGAFEAAGQGLPRRTSLPHPFSNLTREEWARSISLWREYGAPLLKDMPERPCPTCGGTASDHIFQSYDAYPYHECMNCRTWFVFLEITQDLFERYFETVPEARRFGEWSGARDYLRADAPEFELPRAASDLAQTLSPAAIAWQEGFAFAPILFVLARRGDGTAPAGLPAYTAAVAEACRRGLADTYGLQEASHVPRRRGPSVDLADPEWHAEGVVSAGGRLPIDADTSGPFAYLSRSKAMDAQTRAQIRVRGALLSGDLSAGLLQADTWMAQQSTTSPGPFELTLEVPPGTCLNLIICNNDIGCGPAVADIDCVELAGADTRLP